DLAAGDSIRTHDSRQNRCQILFRSKESQPEIVQPVGDPFIARILVSIQREDAMCAVEIRATARLLPAADPVHRPRNARDGQVSSDVISTPYGVFACPV